MSSLISSLAVQKYELTLPTSKKKVEYRAFLVKEEKVLMVASETKNEKDMFRAMRDVVSACTFGAVDVDNAPVVDVEYLFLKIRSRSVGETASPGIKCAKCQRVTETKIDLSQIEPTYDDTHKSKVILNEHLILEMKYPKFSDLVTIEKYSTELEKAIGMICLCINKVHTKTATINSNEVEFSEIEDFVYNFNQEQLNRAMSFIQTMPKLVADVAFTCSQCKHEEKVRLEGIRDFF